jgi:hypothetical protein
VSPQIPNDVPNFNNLGGYNFWLGQLDNHIKTHWDMVQAFIESIEYRERFFAAPFCSAN